MAADRTPGGFGSRLREARERRGVTLREIANATKISIGALEALERNDMSRLPGGIFTRGFVRSYAVEVGLEPEETIQEFIAQFPHDSVTAGATSDQTEDNEMIETGRRMVSAFLRLIAFSVPVAGLVLYSVLAGRQAAPVLLQPSALPPAESAAPSSTPSAAAAAPTTGESPAQPAVTSSDSAQPTVARELDVHRLMVGLATTGRCWVSAAVDGHRVVDRELQAGERLQLEVSHEFVLTAGNPAALTMTFNGAEVRPLGRAGQAVTVHVNLTNFKDYLVGR